MTKKRVGFLMGSFDPIHTGHVNIITSVLNRKVVDKVVLVPSGHNPWKKNEPLPLGYRLELCRLAIEPFQKGTVEVSDIESMFDPPYYSNKPLNHFRMVEYKDWERFIIAGTDTVDKIHMWKDYDTDISPYYRVIEVTRSGDKSTQTSTDAGENINVEISPIDISSTEIRNAIKMGMEIYPLVPASVKKSILENIFFFENK